MSATGERVREWVGRRTGGVFGRDLRISSRRFRTYLLRTGYVALLLLLVYTSWSQSFERVTGTRNIAALSEAGKEFVSTVATYQFFALQAMAAILLCMGFEEELRKRTLGILLTTPLSGWQIVWGKYVGRMIILLGLLACSLPVLALARVFGGVPWQYVVGMLLLTLAGTAMTGAVVLFFASSLRGPVGALLVGGIVVATLNYVPLISPAWGMFGLEAWLRGGSVLGIRGMGSPLLCWAPQSVYALGMAALFLWLTSRSLRKLQVLALMPQTNRPHRPQSPIAGRGRQAVALKGAARVSGKMHGSALLWKELRFFLPVKRSEKVIAGLLFVAILVCSYAIYLSPDMRDAQLAFVPHAVIYLFVGMVLTAALAGPAMTEERRSSSLALLLSLPVSDNHLIWAKALGVIYRSGPVWLLLGLHLAIFLVLGVLPLAAFLEMVLLAGALALFLTGAGLRIGARQSSPVTAAMLTFGSLLGLWYLVPLVVGGLVSPELGEVLLRASPSSLFASIFASLSTNRDRLDVIGPGWIVAAILAYGLGGWMLIVLARRQLRKGIF